MRVKHRLVRRNMKHPFVFPVPCDFSEDQNISILPLALRDSTGNNACSDDNDNANAYANILGIIPATSESISTIVENAIPSDIPNHSSKLTNAMVDSPSMFEATPKIIKKNVRYENLQSSYQSRTPEQK